MRAALRGPAWRAVCRPALAVPRQLPLVTAQLPILQQYRPIVTCQRVITPPTPVPFTLGGLWLNPARSSSTMKKRKKKMNKHKWKKRKKALRMKSARGRER